MNISIEIDGQEVSVPQGSMIIEAADSINAKIPRFCYHKKLPIAANCRMCLVEVEKAPKALPACATPVSAGMKVKTRSKIAIDAQKAVMEFLLINHPLDCPICDQGGQCELQDVAMGYGSDVSRYTEEKRVIKDKNIGPLIATEMTRCIHCTRCVRFGQEIAGVREMGATGRGEFMQIGTYIEKSIDSELSGNIIDLCPVGALTSKPFRYKARAWELKQHPGVAAHDGFGSSIYYHSYHHQVMRVVPKENEAINEVWLSDRDRYSYEGVNSEDRVTQPMVKTDGQWKVASWTEALSLAANIIEGTVVHDGADQLGALISPNATLEERYLLQKLLDTKGIGHIDHHLRMQHPEQYPARTNPVSLGLPIDEIITCDRILIVGSNIQKDIPLLAHRIYQAELNGTEISIVNPVDFQTVCKPVFSEILPGGDILRSLAGILKSLDIHSDTHLLAEVVPTELQKNIAKNLRSGAKKIIFLGTLALNHPHRDQLEYLAHRIAQCTGAQLGFLYEGANSTGQLMVQGLFSEGMSATKMLQSSLSTYLLWNIEPEFDCADGKRALEVLKTAKYVIAVTPFVTENIKQYASVILPLCPSPETAGTFVNLEGKWQNFDAAVIPLGEARPGWKILRVLGDLLDVAGFDYQVIDDVRTEIKIKYELICTDMKPVIHSNNINIIKLALVDLSHTNTQIPILISPTAIYSADNIVRRATALQATKDNLITKYIYINESLENKNLNIKNLNIKIDNTVPDGVALVYAGTGSAQ